MKASIFAVPLLATALLACAPAPSIADPATLASGTMPANAPNPSQLNGAMVAYHGPVQGYLAKPSANVGQVPGVVMIHEWWGLNDTIKAQADVLAREGYAVLAVDLFGTVATTTAEAQKQTGSVKADAAIANVKAAVSYLRSQEKVSKVASLGWCFGGSWSLKLVQAQPDLAAGVIYYGTLTDHASALKGLPPILGIFGDEDQGPSPAQVKAFDAALTTAGVTHEIKSYAGAGHAFANPTGGDRYKPEAATDAWTRTLSFLSKHLKQNQD